MSTREKDKYKSLHKRGYKGKGWKIDHDFKDKLNDKEKEFYNNFLEEFYGANFNHEGKIINKGKAKRKKSYDNNNSANRCVVTKGNALDIDVKGLLESKQSLNQEDILIDLLDAVNKGSHKRKKS
jgi:hypothetical protein